MGRTSKHKAQDPVKMESSSKAAKASDPKDPIKPPRELLAQEHLPPLSLVCCVLVCSGFLFVLGLRDFLATGKNILGPLDEAFLVRIDLVLLCALNLI